MCKVADDDQADAAHSRMWVLLSLQTFYDFIERTVLSHQNRNISDSLSTVCQPNSDSLPSMDMS